MALRVEVPASGKSENATFPSGQDVNAESTGVGTAYEGGDAKAGSVGRMKFDAIAPAIPFTALRLPNRGWLVLASVEGRVEILDAHASWSFTIVLS